MNIRPALALVAVASVVAGGAAVAAPKKPAAKPTCNVLEDAKDDTFLLRSQDSVGAYGPNDAALDIVGGDFGANGKLFTGVIRINKLAQAASTSPSGMSFRLQFATAAMEGKNLYLAANRINGVETFTAGERDITANLATKLADVTGVFDVAKSEVRITAPMSVFAAAGVKPGAKLLLADLDQTSSRPSGAGPSVFADVARSEKTYVVGSASCVVPGK